MLSIAYFLILEYSVSSTVSSWACSWQSLKDPASWGVILTGA